MVKRSRLQSADRRAGASAGRWCRPTAPSIPTPWRRTPRGPSRAGRDCRRPRPAGARPPSGWRCRHGPCRPATSTSRPSIRWKRTSVSWIVWSSAWPMCRLPVTFGGGMHDAIGRAVTGTARRPNAPRRLPRGVDPRLDLGGPVGLVQHGVRASSMVEAGRRRAARSSGLFRRKPPMRQGDRAARRRALAATAGDAR